MARAIPTYERRVLGTGVQQSPQARSTVPASDPATNALANLGEQLNRTATQLLEDERRLTEDRAAVAVANVLSQGDVYWQEDFTRRAQQWKPGAPDMREAIQADFDKWVSESESKLPTEASRNYFRQQAARMRSRLLTNAFSYQEKTITETLNAETAVAIQAEENLVYNDPSRFDEVFTRRSETILARSDLSDADKIKEIEKYRSRLALAAERSLAEHDPLGWRRSRYGEFNGPQEVQAGGAAAVPVTESRIVADAIYGQESSSGRADTSYVNSQNVTGPMQIKRETFEDFKRRGVIPADYDWRNPEQNRDAGYRIVDYYFQKYNGDPAKVAAAYYGGEGAITADGRIRRERRNPVRPSDPSVGEYVDQVMARIRQAGGLIDGGTLTVKASPEALPDAPKTFRALSWEQQAALRSLVETRIKQDEAQFKATMTSAVQDAVAMHKSGIVDPNPLQREDFARAFGAQGQDAYEQYLASREMAADISGFKTQSEAEIMASIEASKPVPGTGYAKDLERYKIRMTAAENVLEQRKKDPALYAVQNNPNLAALRAQIDAPDTTPEQRAQLVQRFSGESIAEQERLGIMNPRVLTEAQADMIGHRIMNAPRPEDAADLIAQLENEYGSKYFPKVFDELVADKKIWGEALIIPNLPSATARETVARLARVKESDLEKVVAPTDAKRAKEQIIEQMKDFVVTVPLMNARSVETINVYESTMRKMAYQMIAAGQSPDSAAEAAYTMLLGHYKFDGTVRFPKHIDDAAVMRGAQKRLEDDLADIDLPDDLIGYRTPDEVRAEWLATVRARPIWLTNDSDSGLELWAMGNNGVRYRVTRGGKPVIYEWATLSADAKELEGTGLRVRERRRAMREAARQRIEETRRQVEMEDRGQ